MDLRYNSTRIIEKYRFYAVILHPNSMPAVANDKKKINVNKEKFQITALKNGTTAEIRITGHIGWETDAESFRSQVDALVKAGTKDVHLYINSQGGNCFDAAEIVNIISSQFKGDITGEGGALVASAATYIALHCKSFEMPENGMFMIHKPSGSASGDSEKIKSYLKMIQDIEKQYYDTYKAAARDLTIFEQKWNSRTDWWLTAKEAKEQGFITGIREKARINRETAAQIKACGCPVEIEINYNNQKEKKEMDLKTTALLLGLPEAATEDETRAKLVANAKAASDLQALQAKQAQKEKDERTAEIKAALDKAIAEKRIKADCRTEWEKMMENNFETASKVLEGIAPVEKLSSQIVTSKEGGKTYKGQSFAQLQEKNPELLAELDADDPEAFAELFNETYKKIGE
jgi:ATP-dependent protease ClpP protease subunit